MGWSGKRKEKSRPFARFTLDPEPTAVKFNDPLDQGKAHPCPITMDVQLVEETN
jgi:hypothetical protein